MVGILAASLLVHMGFRPHRSATLYRLEVISIVGSFFTCYCASFFYQQGGAPLCVLRRVCVCVRLQFVERAAPH